MDIDQIITEAEYNNIRNLSYRDFCTYTMRFVKLCVEESLKAIPSVITHLASQSAYVKTLSDNFYKSNQDLAKKKLLVAKAMEVIEAEHPEYKYTEILDEAAKKARKVIAKFGDIDENEIKDLNFYDSKLKDL